MLSIKAHGPQVTAAGGVDGGRWLRFLADVSRQRWICVDAMAAASCLGKDGLIDKRAGEW